jgi:hypothetical protein
MGKERRAQGFIGEVLMAITRKKSMGGVLLRRPFPETEREGIAGGRRGRSDGRGPHVGEEEEGSGIPVWERFPGPRAHFLFWAERVPRGPFSYFLFLFFFFLFCFLISFVSFAKMLQIKSNHFINSSNIPCNAPN